MLLSFKAGLRAKEIAGLTWSMVTDASGDLTDVISLPNRASKGKRGGRVIPMHPELYEALAALKVVAGDRCRPDLPVVYSERAKGYSANAIAVWFHTRYRELGIQGASSHSGRRTFIHFRGKEDHRSRWQFEGHPGVSRAFVTGHDTTLHRWRYRGEAESHRDDLR